MDDEGIKMKSGYQRFYTNLKLKQKSWQKDKF